MKTNFFLAAGLLVTAFGFSQNTTVAYPATTTGTGELAGTGGQKSVHIGHQAGNSSDDAFNVFVGYQSGLNTYASSSPESQAEYNTFVGYLSGMSNTTGNRNVYVGASAAKNNQAGLFNVIIGSAAGFNSTGDNNVFLGNGTGHGNTGNGSTFIGRFAGNNSTGSNNIFIGNQAGTGNGGSPLSGAANVFIGNYSGAGMTTGHDNVFIGNNVGQSNISPTESDKLYIDNSNVSVPLIYGDFDSSRELKFNAKKVGIGYDTNGAFGDFPSTTGTPDLSSYRLFVRGGILAEEVRIRTSGNWPDYVFADNYNLMPLNEVKKYINDNGHLPNMPSAKEVEEEGLEVGNIVKLQQEKIEELTLHLIEQKEEIETLKKQVQLLLLNKQ